MKTLDSDITGSEEYPITQHELREFIKDLLINKDLVTNIKSIDLYSFKKDVIDKKQVPVSKIDDDIEQHIKMYRKMLNRLRTVKEANKNDENRIKIDNFEITIKGVTDAQSIISIALTELSKMCISNLLYYQNEEFDPEDLEYESLPAYAITSNNIEEIKKFNKSVLNFDEYLNPSFSVYYNNMITLINCLKENKDNDILDLIKEYINLFSLEQNLKRQFNDIFFADLDNIMNSNNDSRINAMDIKSKINQDEIKELKMDKFSFEMRKIGLFIEEEQKKKGGRTKKNRKKYKNKTFKSY